MNKLAWVVLVAVVGSAAGCGDDMTVIDCTPACPPGFSCTEKGCVKGGDGGSTGLPDLGGADAAPCGGRCSGATPVCAQGGVCVACAVDTDCPIGNICKALGGLTLTCIPGCHDDARCGGGSARCCDGACSDTATDNLHCGACATPCAVPHAAANCQAGRCVTSACTAGWGECNGDPADGCEANLHADPSHCGACATACDLPNGVPGCDPLGCYLAACKYGFDDCNGDGKDGCEIATAGDARNCGSCGHACPAVPHAKANCVAGACAVASCDAGWADCDGNPNNGCESSLATDARNCGACGVQCGVNQSCAGGGCTCAQCNFQNARARCVNLMCVLDSCLPGYANCNGIAMDGCEADVTGDARNCGACGVSCPNNAPYCQGGVCSNITLSCADALRANPNSKSGLYTIDPDGNGGAAPYTVYCDMSTNGGGWTAFFAGINGSPNVFNHFEDAAVDCADPAARCLRRLPATVSINSEFLVTCGAAAIRFNVTQPTFIYWSSGVQGGSWINNANPVDLVGNSNTGYAGQTWTGQANNKGWIISAGDRMQPRTFASSYNLNNQWDYCNGVPDVVSPVRLFYR